MQAHCMNLFIMSFLITKLLNSVCIPYAPWFIVGCTQKYSGSLMKLNTVYSIRMSFNFNGFLHFQIRIKCPYSNISISRPCQNIGCECRYTADIWMHINIAQFVNTLQLTYLLAKIHRHLIMCVPYLTLPTGTNRNIIPAIFTECATGEWARITILRAYIFKMRITIH